ncbi:MAG: diaminopimelate epimerase [Planctomycetota bacterium]
MTNMKFFKMHGTGNDFAVFSPARPERTVFTPAFIRKLCDRRFGIGADGVIHILPARRSLGVVGPARNRKADFRMRIFNADGSEAEMCGNGIRCLGKLTYEQGLTNKKKLIIETMSGNVPVELHIKNSKVSKVNVTLPAPSLVRKISASKYKVMMGNPHCVVFIPARTTGVVRSGGDEDLKKFPVAKYGPLLERHRLFPQRTNVEFVRVRNKGAIDMRVWERGVGETLACGTGACAAVIAGIAAKKLRADNVKVNLLGGTLEISQLRNGKISMTGPAETVFEGSVWFAPLERPLTE